jgi:hypothetical protein
MSGQIQTEKIANVGTSLPGSEAFKGIMSEARMSHAGKPNKSFHFLQNSSVERTTTVERYDREYAVSFNYYKDDNEVVLNSIDGNPDIGDTYNAKFIKAMIEGAVESLVNEGSNDSYNDLYNGD